jgi:PTS system fructose-specific IIA component/PTS system nitrogen regulatory IIA component
MERKETTGSRQTGAEKAMIFSSGLAEGVIITELTARTKEDALREIIEKSSKHPKIKNREEFYQRVMEREQIANTYLDRGLALPHARTNTVSGISISLAISRKGIDWKAPDDAPVHIIVLLGAQKSLDEPYLLLLSRIAFVFNDPDIITKMNNCSDSNTLMTIVREREKFLLDLP